MPKCLGNRFLLKFVHKSAKYFYVTAGLFPLRQRWISYFQANPIQSTLSPARRVRVLLPRVVIVGRINVQILEVCTEGAAGLQCIWWLEMQRENSKKGQSTATTWVKPSFPALWVVLSSVFVQWPTNAKWLIELPFLAKDSPSRRWKIDREPSRCRLLCRPNIHGSNFRGSSEKLELTLSFYSENTYIFA